MAFASRQRHFVVKGSVVRSWFTADGALGGPFSSSRSTRRRSFSNNAKIIDLRSDTVTAPSRAMLETALTAPTGDDVLGEDPTIQELQATAAAMLGKAGGLFLPTGTMSNLVALLAHTHDTRDAEVLLGARSHISLWEGGGLATLGGLHVRQLREDDATAEVALDDVRDSFSWDDDDHCAPTKALCLENTHNMLGGIPLSVEYMNAVGDLCHDNQLPGGGTLQLHVDGARIFNAAAFWNVSAAELCRAADSVSVCLSKGLGAPLGSCLVSDNLEFLRLAKRARKKCGGGMRQAGTVAAMGLYALRNNVERLVEDHENARRLAERLQSEGGFVMSQTTQKSSMDENKEESKDNTHNNNNNNKLPPTNVFYFQLPPSATVSADQFTQRLLQDYGVKVSHGYGRGGKLFRIVTHLDVTADDVDRAANAMLAVVRGG